MTDQRSAPKRPIALSRPTDSRNSSSSSRLSPLPQPSPIPPTGSPRRILGIDIENGPDWYGGNDFVYDRIFCLSFKWVNDDDVQTVWIDWGHSDTTIRRHLAPLAAAIDKAEALLGHNFRHDWRGLGTLFRDLTMGNLPARPDRPVIDTMRCIPAGIPRGLDNLCARFDLGEKPHLTNHDWTLALRRKDPDKISLVKHRNRTDVILTERLYHKEREIGWLTSPRMTRR